MGRDEGSHNLQTQMCRVPRNKRGKTRRWSMNILSFEALEVVNLMKVNSGIAGYSSK